MATLRLQSAMEYLMTYGWAILIIAVVLGVLFALGFFNSANLAPKVNGGSCQIYRPFGPGTTGRINTEGICNNELPQYVAKFSGAGSNVVVKTPSITGNGFTVSFWMEPTSPGGGNGASSNGLVYVGSPANYIVIGYQQNLELYVAGGCTGSITTTPTIPINTWAMVTFVNTGSGTGTLYINGANPQTGYGCPSLGSGFTIGQGSATYATNYFRGSIGDVQFYNTSLSGNEITGLYDSGIGAAPQELNNLVGWWPLNGNANDYSGDNYEGFPTSIVYTSSWVSSYTAP